MKLTIFMPQRRIAIVDGTQLEGLIVHFVGRSLIEAGFSVETFKHAVPAVEAIDSRGFDYILASLDVAPGPGKERYPDLNEVYEKSCPIWGSGPDYSEIALWVVKRARQSKLNARTPIVVVSQAEPNSNALYPQAEGRALAAGANEYIFCFDKNWEQQALRGLEGTFGKLSVKM